MFLRFYLVAFVDLRGGKFHQMKLSQPALDQLKESDYIQVLDSQYVEKESLT